MCNGGGARSTHHLKSIQEPSGSLSIVGAGRGGGWGGGGGIVKAETPLQD